MNFQEGVKVVGKKGTDYQYGTYLVFETDHDDDTMCIECVDHEYDQDEVGEVYNYVDMDDFEAVEAQSPSYAAATSVPKLPKVTNTTVNTAILMGWIN